MIRLNLKIIYVVNGFSDESIAKALGFGFIGPMICLRAQKLRDRKCHWRNLFFLQNLRRARISKMPQLLNTVHSEPEILPLKPVEAILPIPSPPKPTNKRIARKRSGGLLSVLDYFFSKEKKNSGDSYKEVLELAKKNPENATFQVKLAEVYQRKGEEEKAIAKYLQAAEVFCRGKFFPQAMVIYKQIISINPHLIHANQKMGEIYREMGYFSDAIAQYKIVANHYEQWGKKERVPEVLKLIQEMEKEKIVREKKAAPYERQKPLESHEDRRNLSPPQPVPSSPAPQNGALPDDKKGLGFDLVAELAVRDPGDFIDPKEIAAQKPFGIEEIFKELQETVIPAEVYPDFNFQMGNACKEMGFNDGAIEQLQIALEKGQKPAEAAKLLSRCYREKGWFHEAQKCYEKAMEIESNNRSKNSSTSELGMVCS
jgi:tetratricopeptide (TPR) repeat protein